MTGPRLASRDRIILVSRLAAFAVLLLIMTSAPAWADGFLTPFLGDDFSGDAFNCTGLTDCQPTRMNYGASLGATGTSVGVEEDLSYAKNFFGAAPGAANAVFSAMSNLLVLGGSGRLQTYFVAGLGLVHASVSLNHASADSTVLGYDAGGGVSDFFTTHLGIRVDVRHFQTFQHVNVPLADRRLGFWRASLGLALKF